VAEVAWARARVAEDMLVDVLQYPQMVTNAIGAKKPVTLFSTALVTVTLISILTKAVVYQNLNDGEYSLTQVNFRTINPKHLRNFSNKAMYTTLKTKKKTPEKIN
jgi:hypothetical protein